MKLKTIKKLAKQADLPRGWTEGPWFDEAGDLREGISDHFRSFIALVELETVETLRRDLRRASKSKMGKAGSITIRLPGNKKTP